MGELLYAEDSYRLIGLGMEVHRELGCGFLEPVYQEAFEILLRREQIPYEREKSLRIKFQGQYLKKEYVADFVCYDRVIVELKALSELTGTHDAQVLNYLKATGFRVGLLFNFGQMSFHHRRLVFGFDDMPWQSPERQSSAIRVPPPKTIRANP